MIIRDLAIDDFEQYKPNVYNFVMDIKIQICGGIRNDNQE